jgi:cyclase
MRRCNPWVRTCTIPLALGLFLASAALSAELAADSPHFQIQKLAEGVWAAIAKPGGFAICNMGIIDLGDEVVLFDSGANPEAARDLAAAALRLTGRAPSKLIYSHDHGDHVFGAAGLPADLEIIGTAKTRDDLIEDDKYTASDIADSARRLPVYQLQERWEAESGKMGQARLWRGYIEAVARLGQSYAIRKPTRLIEGESLMLTGPKRSVVLKVLSGHTDSDVIAVLPQDRIVFAGDLLFVRHQPFLGDSPGTARLLQALDVLDGEKASRYVPGHGEVAGPESIAALRDYVLKLRALVAEAIRAGASADWLVSRGILAPYSDWWFSRFFADNVKVIFKEQEAPKVK